MILVGIGGFFGALSRFYLGKLLVHPYPWATFIINCTGSFALVSYLPYILVIGYGN